MKKTILATGLIGLLIAGGIAGAAIDHKTQKPLLQLYASPNQNSKIIKSYDHAQPLTPFFRQGNWVKVGNSEDGTVGWTKINTLHADHTGKINQVVLKPVTRHPVQPNKTTTHVTNTPYGPVKTTTQIGEANGVKYKIVQSHLETDKMTKTEKQAYFKKMTAQQRAIDAQIQRNIQQMNNTFQQVDQQFNNLPHIQIHFFKAKPNATQVNSKKDHSPHLTKPTTRQ